MRCHVDLSLAELHRVVESKDIVLTLWQMVSLDIRCLSL